MGKHSQHKYTKTGQLPGDVPRKEKIAMLEGDIEYLVRARAYLFDDYEQAFRLQKARSRSFKKDLARKANRRMRRKPIEQE